MRTYCNQKQVKNFN